ncbi:NHLP family bacteriocin export ABC transporter peptidase/permease/ATPase subunit [Hwanghaeella grinnelliae]|uniref:NHLP family bacteriocin export ABC transporter peptidase/permease/ATPase subunit n=1 Tax=Hwanghaeella grinnelliae TaxID=2500179 RepID=A0A437QHC9_9PROT|nr:NHLP family bacteriocin export ABC transporter peptidase/permease/ATPase subunit [Hwanghaeella grinnelliae]RVU33961.1 NHLP family bacteriocin export ABC transporter peptidase/permease/ATPase subunit [Hwanghaeella grinnelliae]
MLRLSNALTRVLELSFQGQYKLLGRTRTPFVLQMEAVECGAAALGMVLGYYGKFVPLTTLRADCGVSRDGSKASNVLKAARKYGLKAKGFSKGIEKLKDVRFPLIVFWEFNHFLVVERISGKYVHVNDPAVGHRKLTLDEFGSGYTGVALTFEPDEGFKKGGTPPNPMPMLIKRIAGSEKALIFMMLAGIIGIVPGMVQAVFSKFFIDAIITEEHYDWLRPMLVAMVALLAFQLCLQAVSGLFSRRLTMGLSAKLYAEFYQHILKLPYHFYTQRYVGDVVNRSQLNNAVVSLMAGQLTSVAIGLVSMVFFGILLFSYNFEITAIGVLSTFINFALIRSMASRRIEANMQIAKEQGKVQGATIAAIQSIESIKASGMENTFFEKWGGYFAASSNASQKLAMDSRMFSIFPTLSSSIVSTLTMVLGGLEVMNGNMTIGTLMAFNLLMAQFLGPISAVLNLAVQMQEIRGTVVRLEDVLEHPTREELFAEVRQNASTDEGRQAAAALGTSLDGSMQCRGLTFGYSPIEGPLIEDFNLEIRPGERVALVGTSGCGKSTVARLVAGLVPPWSGEICFNGVNRELVPQDVLSSSVSFVEQDFLLFPGTVRENLTLWDSTIPDEWLREALDDAVILDQVLAMPGGLDANVEEGGNNLSGGQRQRLEIARALVRRPSFLIMDESTSALDVETEAQIVRNIHRRGCSALMIAHRLSTIRNCHKIIVMQKGAVKEVGDHETLYAQNGIYTKLVKMQ